MFCMSPSLEHKLYEVREFVLFSVVSSASRTIHKKGDIWLKERMNKLRIQKEEFH